MQVFTGVTTLLAVGNRIKQVKGLHALSNLSHLDLSHNQLTVVDGLRTLVRLEVLVSNTTALISRSVTDVAVPCLTLTVLVTIALQLCFPTP